MSNGVLYFPFINVPNTGWFSRTLLYWDTVASVVPYEFVERPERLTCHMRDLVRQGLVQQVIPGHFLRGTPNFGRAFSDYLVGIDDEIETRRVDFTRGKVARVHSEKMLFEIEDKLCQEGLARRMTLRRTRSGPWIEVERRTAGDYMAWLAASIGRLSGTSLTPITDTPANLTPFAPRIDVINSRLQNWRTLLLKKAFPGPVGPITARHIAAFRDKHADLLPGFRRWVEARITELASLTDTDLRYKRYKDICAEIREETTRIKEAMEKFHWTKIVFGDFCAVLAAMLGKGAIPKLINAVYKATQGPGVHAEIPLAYAAYAQERLALAASKQRS
jgi:hypothetical protein